MSDKNKKPVPQTPEEVAAAFQDSLIGNENVAKAFAEIGAPPPQAPVKPVALEDIEDADDSLPEFFKPVKKFLTNKNQVPAKNPYLRLSQEDKHLVLEQLCENTARELNPNATIPEADGKNLFERLELLSRCRNVELISMIQQEVAHAFESGAFDAAGISDSCPEIREAAKRTGNDETHSFPENMKLQMILGPSYLRLVDHARGYRISNTSAFLNGLAHAISGGNM